MPWTYAVSDLKSGEIVETFYKRYLQKTNQKREKTINFMLNGKTTIILSAVGLMKKTQYKKNEHFPELKSSKGRVKDLSNYATKADLKNVTGVDTSKFAKKIDLASLKSEVDKLEQVPTGSSSLKNKVDK